MLATVYIFEAATKPPLRLTIDPVEHAAYTIDSALNTMLIHIHKADLTDVRQIERHLKFLSIEIASVLNAAAHREHSLMDGH